MPTCLRLTYLVMIVVLGCRHEDRYFCENAPHHNCLALDAAPDTTDALEGCTMDQDCAAPTAVCDVGTMKCVQCTAAEHDACIGNQPVCGVNHECRSCAAHAECSMSLACLPDGSCGTDANVAYVDPAGTDNNVCSYATPCTMVAKALATGKPFVKFQGATGKTDEAVAIKGGRQVTFLADSGARLTRTQGNGAIVTVQDNATSLSIYDLTISDAPNAPSGIGCVIPAGGGGVATLSLTRVKLMNDPGGGISAAGGTVTISNSTIAGNQAGGISATGSTITITQSMITGNQAGGISTMGGSITISESTITGNQGGGISTTGGSTTISQTTITGNQGSGVSTMTTTTSISQSTIIGNRGGGVSVMNGTFGIANNVIADNGDASASGSDYGGLSLTGSGTDRLEFNTIAYNHAKPGTLLSAGVACSVTGLVAPNNLITSNNEGVTFPAQTKGVCTFGNSYTMPGTGENTLAFRSISAPLDLHLTASSPASVVDAAGVCTVKDIDGDARPIGGACDLGADERNP